MRPSVAIFADARIALEAAGRADLANELADEEIRLGRQIEGWRGVYENFMGWHREARKVARLVKCSDPKCRHGSSTWFRRKPWCGMHANQQKRAWRRA